MDTDFRRGRKYLSFPSLFLGVISTLSIGVLIILLPWWGILIALWMFIVTGVALFRHLKPKRQLWRQRDQLADLIDGKPIQKTKETWPEVATLEAQLGEAIQGIELVSNMKPLTPYDKLTTDRGIGQALTMAQSRMESFREQEQRQSWIVQGLAQFADMMKMEFSDSREFGLAILRKLVKHLRANQGGFYVLGEYQGEEVLNLHASFAYDSERHKVQRVYKGEGALGQVLIDKKLRYVKDLPEGYSYITSGLGDATPVCMVIIPLVLRDVLYGVIELLSFHPMKPHELEFLEQLRENLAGSLSEQTSKRQSQSILSEFQSLTEDLQKQDVEMRENLTELQSTQEKMRRNETELTGVINAVSSILGLAQIDLAGNIVQSNDRFAKMMGTTPKKLKQTPLFSFWDETWFRENVSPSLRANRSIQLEHFGSLRGKEYWWNSSFAPLLNGQKDLYGVMILSEDISHRKQRELEFEQLSLVANHTTNSVVVTDAEGLVQYVNHGFLELTGYTLEEIQGKKPGHVLQGDQTDAKAVARIRKAIQKQKPIVEDILNYRKDKTPYWVNLVINPVRNADNEVVQFVAIQADITQSKLQSMDFKYKFAAFEKTNMVVEIALDGTITQANRLAHQFFRVHESELIGQSIHKLFPYHQLVDGKLDFWDDLENNQLPPSQVYRGGEAGEGYMRGTFVVIFDHVQKPIKYLLFASDITEERRLQSRSERQQAELEGTFRAISYNLASCTFDLNEVVVEANDIFGSILGYGPAAMVGMKYLEFVPEELRDRPQHSLMWDNLRAGQYFTGEFMMEDAKGDTHWLSGTFSAIMDSENKPYKVVMIAQFTTREKEKQQELENSIDALKQVLAVLEFSPRGMVKSSSPLFLSLAGLTVKDMLRKSITKLVPAMDADAWDALLQELEQRSSMTVTWALEINDLAKNFNVTLYPVFSLQGKLAKVLTLWSLTDGKPQLTQ